MNNERKTQLLELLNIAKEMVNNGQELSTEYARVFFPPERREYELTYTPCCKEVRIWQTLVWNNCLEEKNTIS